MYVVKACQIVKRTNFRILAVHCCSPVFWSITMNNCGSSWSPEEIHYPFLEPWLDTTCEPILPKSQKLP